MTVFWIHSIHHVLLIYVIRFTSCDFSKKGNSNTTFFFVNSPVAILPLDVDFLIIFSRCSW